MKKKPMQKFIIFLIAIEFLSIIVAISIIFELEWLQYLVTFLFIPLVFVFFFFVYGSFLEATNEEHYKMEKIIKNLRDDLEDEVNEN